MRIVAPAALLITLLISSNSQAEPRKYTHATTDFHLTYTIYTEAEMDSVFTDEQARKEFQEGRAKLAKDIADSLGLRVTLVAMMVEMSESSQLGLHFTNNLEYGFRRDDQEIAALHLRGDFVIVPGQTVMAMLVFMKMEILPTDEFYIHPRE